MGLLTNSTVYLAGAIEHEQSPTSWREQIKRELLYPLGIKVYDPLVKPSYLSELARGDPRAYRPMLGDNLGPHIKDQSRCVSDIMCPDSHYNSPRNKVWPALAEIRHLDRRFAYDCNFMICNLPLKPTFGTVEELSIASQCNKPVLLYSPDGIISTWLPPMLAMDQYDYFENTHFDTLDKLHAFVRRVDGGDLRTVDNIKWIFITYFADRDVVSHVAKSTMEAVGATEHAK